MKTFDYRCGRCGQSVVYPQTSDSFIELKQVFCLRCKQLMKCSLFETHVEQVKEQPKISRYEAPRPIGA
jgi:DNA-directed RNA polymerase subunit RPC12/RpoP